MGKLVRTVYCGDCRYLNREAKPGANLTEVAVYKRTDWAFKSGRSSKQGLHLKVPVPCNSDWNGSKSLLGDEAWVYSLKNKTEPKPTNIWDSYPWEECPFLCVWLFWVDLGVFVLSQWQPIPVFLTMHNAAEVITCGFQKFVQKEVIDLIIDAFKVPSVI